MKQEGNVRICQFMHSIFMYFDDILLWFKPFELKIGRHVLWDSFNVRA